jgi:hypothetical protein
MKNYAHSLLAIALLVIWSNCAATPQLDHDALSKIAKSQSLSSIWRQSVQPGVAPDADYVAFFYSKPKKIAKDVCAIHETMLSIRMLGTTKDVVDRTESDRIAFKKCQGLEPEDFVQISNNTDKIPTHEVVRILQGGLPTFGGLPSSIQGAPELRQCFNSLSATNLASVFVYSASQVSAIFTAGGTCSKEVEAKLIRSEDGTIHTTLQEALSPYIK